MKGKIEAGPVVIEGDLKGGGLKMAVVVSRFNHFITDRLLEGCLDALDRHGVALGDVTVVKVPGSFEIPLVARKLAGGKGFNAVICLGNVMRGDTPHNEYIAAEVIKGIAQASMETGTPIVYGVITPETLEQAIERAGTKGGNKGWEAAVAAIEMANLSKKVK
ncbi:MAG: 6,7-dimethyl-8-ribityllumazine synthase [Pseudomonadota bacterium]